MSWFLNFIAEDKIVAQEHIRNLPQSAGVPDVVEEAIQKICEKFLPGSVISIETSGHLGNVHENCTIKIEGVQMIKGTKRAEND